MIKIITPDNQALDRTAPVLPMMPGMPERRTHDYVRNGTTTLFAALDIATGLVISELHRQHRAAEFKKFLATIDRQVPAGLEIHIVADNYATHKTPAIQAWLAAHPRIHMHFTPTSSSWLNQVERWFGELTAKMLRRGAHTVRAGPRSRHPGLDRQLEQRPTAIHLDQNRRPDPRITRTTSATNFRRGLLAALPGAATGAGCRQSRGGGRW